MFAASCRELQAGSLCSPNPERHHQHSRCSDHDPAFFSVMISAGKLACLIISLTFGKSSFLSCAHFFNCSSSWLLNVSNTSSCDFVGSPSPDSIVWLNVSKRSFSMFG